MQTIGEKTKEAAGALDPSVAQSIGDLVELSRNPKGNKEKIEEVAKALRENEFLLAQRFYLHVEVISRRSNVPFRGQVLLVSGISYRVDYVEQHDVNGQATIIKYLGDRLDRLNKDIQALGFTYYGDTHGVVVKEVIQASFNYSILSHLRGAPIRVAEGKKAHPLNATIRRALLRDLLEDPSDGEIEMLYERRYRSTAIHEQQHNEDEINGIQRGHAMIGDVRVAEEVSAYCYR